MNRSAAPESQSNIPASWLIPMSRRKLAKGVIIGLTLSQLPDLTYAQTKTLDPFWVREITPAEEAIANSTIGKTSAAEIASARLHVGADRLPNDFVRYIYPSRAPYRPHLVITDEKDRMVFKRRVLAGHNPPLSGKLLNDLLGQPPSFTASPFTFDNFHPLFTETRIWSDKGIAAVVQKPSDEVLEVHAFPKSPNPSEYIKTWAEGDFDPDAPKHPLGLVLIDGFLSNPQNKTFERFEKDLFPYYQKVAKFSYAGNDRADYGETDTFQSIYKSAEILKELIDKLKAYHPLDILAYSLGGAVFNAYAAMYVLRVNGPHREGVIRKFVSLHSPIHGIPHYLLSGANVDSVQELLAMAENPEITIPINIALAKVLRDRRSVGTLNLGNESDCISPPGFSVNIGFGTNKDLGRGKNGIKNCTDMINSVFPDLNIADNAGHTGLLSDYGTIKTVERFLKSAQLTAFLGEQI